MTTIEENIDVRFVDMEVYKAMRNEISREGIRGQYEKHVQELEVKQQELEKAKKEHGELLPKLGVSLDKWCGGCRGGWGKCDQRVKYLMDTYGTKEDKAKIDIMKAGKCILPAK